MIDHTLFGPVARAGFIGVGISKFVLTDWVRSWRDAVQKATGK